MSPCSVVLLLLIATYSNCYGHPSNNIPIATANSSEVVEDKPIGGAIPTEWMDVIEKLIPAAKAVNSVFGTKIENDTLKHLNETVAKNISVLSAQMTTMDKKLTEVLPVVNILTTLATDVKKEMSTRVYKLEGRVSGVETKLGGVEKRLGGVETKLGGVEDKLVKLDNTVVNGHEFLKGKFVGVETRLGGVETKFVGVETRLGGVEDKLAKLEITVVNGHEFLKGKISNMSGEISTINQSLAIITKWIERHNKTLPVTSNHIRKI